MANQFPTNNYNDSGANKGQAGTGNALYADNHYLDGDGFIYGIGKVSERVLVKTKDLYDNSLKWYPNSGQDDKTKYTLGVQLAGSPYLGLSGLEVVDVTENNSRQIGLRVALASSNQISDYNLLSRGSDGLYVTPTAIIDRLFFKDSGHPESIIDGIGPIYTELNNGHGKIGLNLGKGLYTGAVTGSGKVLNINLYEKEVQGSGSSSTTIENASGLEFATGVADNTDNKPAENQLKIKLREKTLPGSTTPVNASGLWLDTPYTSGSGATAESYSGGLKIFHDNTLLINGNGALSVNTDVIVPNITGTLPIVATPGDSSVNIKLNYTSSFGVSAGNLSLNYAGVAGATGSVAGGVKVSGSATGSSFGNAYAGPIGIDSSTGEIRVKIAGDSWYGAIKLDSAGDSDLHRSLKQNASGAYIDQILRAVYVNDVTPPLLSNTDIKPLRFLDGTGITIYGTTNEDYGNVTISLKAASTGTIGGVKITNKSDSAVAADVTGTGISNGTARLRTDTDNLGYVNIPVITSSEATQGSTKNAVPYSAGYTDELFARKTQVAIDIQTALDGVSGRIFVITTKTAMEAGGTYAPIEANKKYICLVPTGGASPDSYEEYMLITVPNGSTSTLKWEKIGDTKFSTDTFIAKTAFLTAAEVNAIVTDVFGF